MSEFDWSYRERSGTAPCRSGHYTPPGAAPAAPTADRVSFSSDWPEGSPHSVRPPLQSWHRRSKDPAVHGKGRLAYHARLRHIIVDLDASQVLAGGKVPQRNWPDRRGSAGRLEHLFRSLRHRPAVLQDREHRAQRRLLRL